MPFFLSFVLLLFVTLPLLDDRWDGQQYFNVDFCLQKHNSELIISIFMICLSLFWSLFFVLFFIIILFDLNTYRWPNLHQNSYICLGLGSYQWKIARIWKIQDKFHSDWFETWVKYFSIISSPSFSTISYYFSFRCVFMHICIHLYANV